MGPGLPEACTLTREHTVEQVSFVVPFYTIVVQDSSSQVVVHQSKVQIDRMYENF